MPTCDNSSQASKRKTAEKARLEQVERERLAAALTKDIERRFDEFGADPIAIVPADLDAVGGQINQLRDLGAAKNVVARFEKTLQTERQALALSTRARDLMRKGRLDEALAGLGEFQPPHPLITADIVAVRDAITRRDEEAARKAAEQERVRQEAERARIAAERARAEAIEREHQAFEQRVTTAIASATTRFAAGEHQQAIDELVVFAPAHPLVKATLADLRQQLAGIEKERRAEKARLEQLERERLAAALTKDIQRRFDELGEQITIIPADLDAVGSRNQPTARAWRSEKRRRQV